MSGIEGGRLGPPEAGQALEELQGEALLDAVRWCWGGLFTERAVLYRARGGFGHRSVEFPGRFPMTGPPRRVEES